MAPDWDFIQSWALWRTLIRLDSQLTRDIEPLLIQCWADVVAGGPTLNQHWFNITAGLD